jgi:hypothetical protein
LPFIRKNSIISIDPRHFARMKFFTDIRLLLIAIWIGASVFFIAVAASAFAVLPQREMAGAVVNRTLTVLNFGGIAISVILILTTMVRGNLIKPLWIWAERVLLLVVAAACAAGQFVIGYMMQSVRGQMGGRPIDEIAVDDPLRIQFNQLHESSVWMLYIAMAAAMLAFFVVANRKKAVEKAKDPLDPYNFEKEFKI